MTREGVDYAWARPDPAALAAAGITFACRYLSHDASKSLTAAEAQALIAHGIAVVCNWESDASRALAGQQAGHDDAVEAVRQAQACGAPAGAAIYFSVDFDATAAQLDAVRAYFAGVRSGLAGSGYGAGAYGGYATVDALLTAGLIEWVWQTLAWSGGRVHPSAHIFQHAIEQRLAGADVDLNRALREPFGQWPGGATPSTGSTTATLLLMA